MLERVKQTVTAHQTTCAVILAVLLVCIAYAVGRYAGHEAAEEKPTVMTQEETQDAKELKNRLDVSTANANALEKRITAIQAGRSAPTTTYYVSAQTVERAAQVVERQIREDAPTLPRAAREKSDRTIVTPITKDKDGNTRRRSRKSMSTRSTSTRRIRSRRVSRRLIRRPTGRRAYSSGAGKVLCMDRQARLRAAV